MKGFSGQSEHEMAMLKLHGYCSGDRAVADEHGGVASLERTEETLQIRSEKVNPAEIEAVLRRHSGVAECAVTGMLEANGKLETALHAFVAPTARGALLTEGLKTYCRAFLQPHRSRRASIFMRRFPSRRTAGSCAKHSKPRRRSRRRRIGKSAERIF